MTEEIELSVEEVKDMLAASETADPLIRHFLGTLRFQTLCSDWMKLRARASNAGQEGEG